MLLTASKNGTPLSNFMVNSKDIFLRDPKFGCSRKNSNNNDLKSTNGSEMKYKRRKREQHIILDDEIADIQNIADKLYGPKTKIRQSPRFNYA